MSHRAVAARAGVPLAATTYYFSCLDDLLDAGLRAVADAWLARAQAVLDSLPPTVDDAAVLARAVVDAVLGGPDPVDDSAVLTMYERFLQAGRSPHLRSAVTAYGARLDAVLLEVLRRGWPGADEGAVRSVLAALDGTVLRALAEGRPVVPAATAVVQPLLAGVAAAPTGVRSRGGPPR